MWRWIKDNELRLIKLSFVPAPMFFYWWLPRMPSEVDPAELSRYLNALLAMAAFGGVVLTLDTFTEYLSWRLPAAAAGSQGVDAGRSPRMWLTLRLAASAVVLFALVGADLGGQSYNGLIRPAATVLVTLCLAPQGLCAAARAARAAHPPRV